MKPRGREQRRIGGRLRLWRGLGLAVVLAAVAGGAEERTEETLEHRHPSGAFTFRAPASWTLEIPTVRKDLVQVSGAEGIVWFSYRRGEYGYDSLHVNCMSERLTGKIGAGPVLAVEYDSREGGLAGRAALDSAFLVSVPTPVREQSIWRMRAVTVVGGGESVCIVAYVPAASWKASKQVRRVVDGIVASLTFRSEP